MSKIIRKTSKEKEKNLLDDLLSQIESEKEQTLEDSAPIAITDEVKTKMIKLMDAYLQNKDKLAKVNAIKKELTTQSSTHSKDLQTLMKLYGLNELIKGNNKFVLDQTVKKKPLKKDEFRQVISAVLGDKTKVEEIYNTANDYAEEVFVEKLKCLKYRGD